jgi:hypothetical protein
MGDIKVSHYEWSLYVLLSLLSMFDEIGCTEIGCIYMLIIVTSFWCISPFISMKCPFLFHLINVTEVYFVCGKYCYSCLFLWAIGLVNLLPTFRPEPVFVSVNDMGLL